MSGGHEQAAVDLAQPLFLIEDGTWEIFAPEENRRSVKRMKMGYRDEMHGKNEGGSGGVPLT